MCFYVWRVLTRVVEFAKLMVGQLKHNSFDLLDSQQKRQPLKILSVNLLIVIEHNATPIWYLKFAQCFYIGSLIRRFSKSLESTLTIFGAKIKVFNQLL